MSTNQTNVQPGMMLGRYRLLDQPRHGRLGDVWLAEDSQLRRQVALKVLAITPGSEQQVLPIFLQMARAASSLDHPNILPVHEFGEQHLGNNQTIAFLVLPFISGGTLRERLRHANGALPPAEAIAYLRQAGQAIDYAHSKQTLHGDLKPSNMLLQNTWLYVADFGLARLMGLLPGTALAGRPPVVAGTPEYMAPEQAQGYAGPASDRYSLAVVAYQLLTGRLPFEGDPPTVLRKQAQEEPLRPRQFNQAMPLVIEQALLWGLAKQPSSRPPTCKALVDALEGNWLHAGEASNMDREGTVLAPWSRRLAEQQQPPTVISQNNPLPDIATMRPGYVPVPYAPQLPSQLRAQPTPLPFMPVTPVTPAGTPYGPNSQNAPTFSNAPINASAPSATTFGPNAANAPTSRTDGQRTPVMVPLPPDSPGRQGGNVSRRALLIGGIGAVVVAAGGGTLLYYLHNNSGGNVLHRPVHATPTPAPGPHKLVIGTPILSLTGHSKSVEQVAWDASGRYLATGSEDSHIMLWDIGSKLKSASSLQSIATPLRDWKLPQQIYQYGFCWSADGRTIAAVVLDSNIYMINAASSAEPQTYQDTSQKNNVIGPSYATIAWSPTSSSFATYDLNAGNKMQAGLWQHGHANGPVQTLSYSDANSSQLGAALDAISWSSDGKLFAGHANFGEVAIWDVASKKAIQIIPLPDRPQFKGVFITDEYIVWSPTEQVLAISDLDLTYIWDVAHNKHLLTLQVNEPLLQHDIHPPLAWGATWSPNGRYLALCYARSPRIYIWDIQSLRASATAQSPVSQILTFPQKTITNGATITIAWSPDGRYIAGGYGDSTVIVWKVDSAA